MKKSAGLVAGLLVWDMFSWCLGVACYWGAARATVALLAPLGSVMPQVLWWMLASLAFVLVLTLEIAVLHRVCPRPRAGRHAVAKSVGFWAQMLNMTLSRILFLGALRPLFHSMSFLRYLGYRALGARIDFTVSTSSDAVILDPAMMTLGAGVTLGARSLLSGHYFKDGCVVMAPIVIGENVLFGWKPPAAPGAVIGSGTMLLPFAKVGQYAQIGEGVVVGSEAFVDHRAVVPAGTHVGARTMFARPKV